MWSRVALNSAPECWNHRIKPPYMAQIQVEAVLRVMCTMCVCRSLHWSQEDIKVTKAGVTSRCQPPCGWEPMLSLLPMLSTVKPSLRPQNRCFLKHLCSQVLGVCVHMSECTGGVRRTLVSISSFLPMCASQEVNSDCSFQQPQPLPAELPHSHNFQNISSSH